MTIDDSTPVVVLRLDHYGSLGIIRTLGRLGVDVYGIHANKHVPAFYSRYCQRMFVWDLDAAPAPESVEYLLELARRLGGRAVLVPSNDETAIFAAENAAALRGSFVYPLNNANLVHSLCSKKDMHFLANQCGVPTADAAFPLSRADAEHFCETAQFPVMVKASDGIVLARRTGMKMVIVHSASELLAAYDKLEDPLHPNLMLQEYIPGGDDSVWMFNGYFDENSSCLAGFTGKKIHQNPVYTGMTCLGVCLPNDTVHLTTLRFMKAIGYKGILDIGYRYDRRDGQYKVLDVNPRVGATFRLFVGDDGLDVVRAMYLHLTGQPVPRSRLVEGRKWVVEDLNLLSFLRYRQDGVLTTRQWLRSFAGVKEAAWLASDDMMPFCRMAANLIARPFRRFSKKLKAGRLRPSSTLRMSNAR